MKFSLSLTAAILIVGFLWSRHENIKLTTIREKHRQILIEAATLGVSSDPNHPHSTPNPSHRQREDSTRKVKNYADFLVRFSRENKEQESSGNPPDPEKQQERISELIEGMLSLNAAELKMLVAELKTRSDMDDDTRSGLVGFAITMLAQDHPGAALALFTESSDFIGNKMRSAHVVSTALRQLAEEQPLAAVAWIRDHSINHPDLITDETKWAALEGTAKTDLKLALQLASELKMEQKSGNILSHLVDHLETPEQQLSGLAALRSLPTNDEKSQEDQKRALVGLLSQVSQAGFNSSMDWMKSANLSPAENNAFIEGLMQSSVEDDTGKWLDWISTQNTRNTPTDDVIQQLMQRWTYLDYRTAGTWLAQAPASPMKEAATLSYIETVARYDSQTAAQWAETLPPPQKAKALKTIQEYSPNPSR